MIYIYYLIVDLFAGFVYKTIPVREITFGEHKTFHESPLPE